MSRQHAPKEIFGTATLCDNTLVPAPHTAQGAIECVVMTPKYNTGVIARPARLVNETGNPLCEFAEVLIRIYEQHTAPFGSINTTPSIKELHLPQTEDDTFFLQIEGYPDHRLPVRISGVGLWVQGNPQLRGENGWTDESWHQLADAIPHSSSVVS